MKREYKNIQDMTKMSKLFLEIWKLLEKDKFITKEDIFDFCDSMNIDKQLWRRVFLQLIKNNEIKEISWTKVYCSSEKDSIEYWEIDSLVKKIRKDARVTWLYSLRKNFWKTNSKWNNFFYYTYFTLWKSEKIKIEIWNKKFWINLISVTKELYELWYSKWNEYFVEEKTYLDTLFIWTEWIDYTDILLTEDIMSSIEKAIKDWILDLYKNNWWDVEWIKDFFIYNVKEMLW